MELMPLYPYPGSPEILVSGVEIAAGARISGGRLELLYQMGFPAGSLAERELLPFRTLSPRRKEQLWKQTCFEAFLGIQNSDAYCEFNGSLSGEWDFYFFDSYRNGMQPVPLVPSEAPLIRSRGFSEGSLRIGWSIPLPAARPVDRIGITMVLNAGPHTAYWALNHAGEKPDFHLRESFIYDPVRS
jgi:hypothetical protein